VRSWTPAALPMKDSPPSTPYESQLAPRAAGTRPAMDDGAPSLNSHEEGVRVEIEHLRLPRSVLRSGPCAGRGPPRLVYSALGETISHPQMQIDI